MKTVAALAVYNPI